MVSEKEVEAALSGWHRALIDAHDEPVDERRRRCIRAALSAAARVRAEDNAEPVAWEWDQLMHDSMGGWEHKIEKCRPSSAVKESDIRNLRPLYTHPAPQPSGPVEVNDEVRDILNAVAHIGVDFGYGAYELEPKFIEAARRILSALTAGKPEQVVPSGWKLVPEEPTEGMVEAGWRFCEDPNYLDKNAAEREASDCYRAMLAASPAPPTAGGGE